MHRLLHITVSLLWVAIATPSVCGNPALLRASGTAPAKVIVEQWSGPVAARLTPVTPSRDVTVAIIMDGVSAGELRATSQSIDSLYSTMRGKGALRIAALQRGSLTMAGPFATTEQLQAALRELSGMAAAASTDPRAIETIVSNAPQLGGKWSALIVTGGNPHVDESAAEFASATLAEALAAQRIRLFAAVPDSEAALWRPVAAATGGAVRPSLADFIPSLSETSERYLEVAWNEEALAHGFDIYKAKITDGAGGVLAEIPDLVHSSDPLPSSAEYAELRRSVSEASAIASTAYDQSGAERIRAALGHALGINPGDVQALRLGASVYEHVSDFKTAAKFWSELAQVRPADPATFVSLGECQFRANMFDEAERSLTHARELGAAAATGTLALIRIHRGDGAGALALLAEALKADPRRQDLWFAQADSAFAADQRQLGAESLEHGIALGGADLRARRKQLADYYFEANLRDKALQQVRAAAATPARDAKLRGELAELSEKLNQRDEALSLWRESLDLDPAYEIAQYHVARLLLERSEASAALAITNKAVESGAASARIYLTQADAFDALGRSYRWRSTLRAAAGRFPQPDVLRALAEAEDSFPASAPAAWTELARSLEKADAKQDDIVPVLRRGLIASIRDFEPRSIAWFGDQLAAHGDNGFANRLTPRVADQQETTALPGGADALAFMARGRDKQPADRFFAAYCRTLADQQGDKRRAPEIKAYAAALETYFQTLQTLQSLGKRARNDIIVSLSAADAQSRRNAEKVLSLLGIRMRTANGSFTIQESVNHTDALRHDVAAALAVDEQAIADAFSHGKPYELDIPVEQAPVYPSEKLWRDSFYSGAGLYGGFAEAAAQQPQMATLYIAFSVLDRDTIRALVAAHPLKTLAEKYGDALLRASGAFSVRKGHALVPGGVEAEPIWASLAGAAPADPPAFFRALLDKDDGHLLAYFSLLSDVDAEHQRFFTASAARTGRFYKAFQNTPEARGPQTRLRSDAFGAFLSGVPLDGRGRVAFPGSPQVWMVARGKTASLDGTRKMLRKLSRIAAPDQEDDVLLRLAETSYNDAAARRSELDNFLAVARLNEHRADPMDEETALLLAQNYSAYGGIYPYFTSITGLDAAGFRAVFALFNKLDAQRNTGTNSVLGQVHAFLEFTSLLQRRGALDQTAAANLVLGMCRRFVQASGDADYAAASAATIGALRSALHAPQQVSTDRFLRDALIGHADGDPATSGRRAHDFDRVLELQKAPPLDALLEIQKSLAVISAGRPAPAEMDAIERALQRIPAVSLKTSRMSLRDRDHLTRFDLERAQRTAAEMRKKLRGNRDSKELDRLSRELMADLNPQYALALSGVIYAWYLRPDDLVIASDPLLLRKHHYYDFSSPIRVPIVPTADYVTDPQGSGSYLLGGFARFAYTSGMAAAAGFRAGRGVGPVEIAAQLGSVRDTDWDLLRESDLRIAGLRVQVAREWVVRSALDPSLFDSLARNTLGLLSANRRAELLTGIEQRRWRSAWSSMTLADLYFLGVRYSQQYDRDPWQSPTTAQLRALLQRSETRHLNVLGSVAGALFGCDHPHLRSMPPYEEYEKRLLPSEMAERTAEFKLHLAWAADAAGIDPAVLGRIAEPLAADTLAHLEMDDPSDWRSLMAALDRVNENSLRAALDVAP